MIAKVLAKVTSILAILAASASGAQEKVANVSTLEWPPYTSANLPLNGATSEIVRAAFEQSGYQTSVTFRPWKRAIDSAAKGTDGIIAYFPGYHCTHSAGFVASDPIGNGPLGFAEHADAPIKWDSLEDLSTQQLRIGTVLGYANTEAFDQMVAEKWINALDAKDDLTNLKKLAKRRVDAVVIDKLVLEFMKATDPALQAAGDSLQFNPRPLEDKTLYLCFRDDETGLKLRDIFNSGLARINSEEIVDNYFSSAFSE